MKAARINAEIKQVVWDDVPAHELPSSSRTISPNTSGDGGENFGEDANGSSLHASQPIGSLVKDKPTYLKVSVVYKILTSIYS